MENKYTYLQMDTIVSYSIYQFGENAKSGEYIYLRNFNCFDKRHLALLNIAGIAAKFYNKKIHIDCGFLQSKYTKFKFRKKMKIDKSINISYICNKDMLQV